MLRFLKRFNLNLFFRLEKNFHYSILFSLVLVIINLFIILICKINAFIYFNKVRNFKKSCNASSI